MSSKNTESLVFKNKEDFFPVFFITLGLVFSLVPFLVKEYNVPIILMGVMGILFRVLVPIHQHYHSHVSTFRSEFLNIIYDIVLSLAGGNLTALWKVHHCMGHHSEYLDPKNDLEGNLRFGENKSFQRLQFTVLGDFLSLYDSIIYLNRFSDKLKKRLQHKIFYQFAVQLILFLFLFLWNKKLTLLIFVIPNLVFRWSVFWFSYGQHDELPMTGVYDSSTTRFKFNTVFLNVGLHTAHHEKPNLHWSKLEDRTKKILHLINPKCLPGYKAR